MGFRNPITSLGADQITAGTLAPSVIGRGIATAAAGRRVVVSADPGSAGQIDFYSDPSGVGQPEGHAAIAVAPFGGVSGDTTMTITAGSGTLMLQRQDLAGGGHTLRTVVAGDLVADNIAAGKADIPFLQMHRDTMLAIAANTDSSLTFSAVDPNSDTSLQHSGDLVWFTSPAAGWYAVDATVIFQNVGSGAADTRAIKWGFWRSGVTSVVQAAAGPASVAANYTVMHASDVVWLNAGDLLNVVVWSNITLSIMPGTRASMRWLRRGGQGI